MLTIDRSKIIDYQPTISNNNQDGLKISLYSSSEDLEVYKITVPKTYTEKVIIKWKFEAKGVRGSWSSNAILDKRFRTDWEFPQLSSSISVDAPIISIYGYEDENLLTYCISDAVLESKLEASLREEDNHIYCTLQLLTDSIPEKDYETYLYISKQTKQFSTIIQEAAEWIIERSALEPHAVPYLAISPLYSTWYAFHQSLNEEKLLSECKRAKEIGMELIIIDDGWQTMDEGRGYDYTGDWLSERFGDMKLFVEQVHNLDMGIMLWYSVPFCGKKSKAYATFKGKFLTENHFWAPVFDPRFPEVRNYLKSLYAQALIEWNIDGFKLDFIDDFKVYSDTEMNELNGRDTLSVALGVEKLIDEICEALFKIKKDVLVEFRQQYINPTLRRLGNMFRAFDCPNDSLMNRVRTTDTKLICGKSAVHSDMLTWHEMESLEVIALQFTNILFSVPQVSLQLEKCSKEEIQLIQHYLNYWLSNKQILLYGNFIAHKPLANYPILQSKHEGKIIYGLYEDTPIRLCNDCDRIDIINGKLTEEVFLICDENSTWNANILDCLGNKSFIGQLNFDQAINLTHCPKNGILQLSTIENEK